MERSRLTENNKRAQRGKRVIHAPRAMKCIVINLPRAEARRRAMRQQFDALGIEFEILDVIDWRDLSEADWALVDRKSRNRQGRRVLSNLREEVLKRVCFSRKVRSARNAGDSG